MSRWGERVQGGLVRPAEATEVGEEIEDVIEAVEKRDGEALPGVGFLRVEGVLGGEYFGVIN